MRSLMILLLALAAFGGVAFAGPPKPGSDTTTCWKVKCCNEVGCWSIRRPIVHGCDVTTSSCDPGPGACNPQTMTCALVCDEHGCEHWPLAAVL